MRNKQALVFPKSIKYIEIARFQQCLKYYLKNSSSGLSCLGKVVWIAKLTGVLN
jgi:hypothetical protein